MPRTGRWFTAKITASPCASTAEPTSPISISAQYSHDLPHHPAKIQVD